MVISKGVVNSLMMQVYASKFGECIVIRGNEQNCAVMRAIVPMLETCIADMRDHLADHRELNNNCGYRIEHSDEYGNDIFIGKEVFK